jgi:hypothetical protein
VTSSVRETILVIGQPNLGERSETVADLRGRLTATIRRCPWLSGLPRPQRGPQVVSGPAIGLRSVLDSLSNLCSILWFGGDLARPGPGPADRGAAGAVRGAARRRPGNDSRGGRQRRALSPRRRHQDLEPHAARAPAPARGLRAAARRLPSTADGPQPPVHRNSSCPVRGRIVRARATASLSGIFAGCVQAARALGDQVIGDMSVTVVVRWVPDLSV